MYPIESLPEEMIQSIMDNLTVTSLKSLFDVSRRMRASVIDYITHSPEAILRFDELMNTSVSTLDSVRSHGKI